MTRPILNHRILGDPAHSPARFSRTVTRAPRSEHATLRVGPRLVLALSGETRPTASLRRAVALARSLDSELHVLRVLPRLSHGRGLHPAHRRLVAARTVQQTLLESQKIRAWLRVSLGDVSVIERLSMVHGDFVERVAAHAAKVNACMIIVPPHPQRLGRTVTTLARVAQRPVLVAREHQGNPAILAATDLHTTGHPVLWQAVALGRRLGARLVAFHNSDPGAMAIAAFPAGAMAAGPFTVGAAWTGLENTARLRAARWERLTAAAAELPVDVNTVMVDQVGSARAILDQTRRIDPDWVVVGTRQRSWFERLASTSISGQVVERAGASVLVVPLELAARELPRLPRSDFARAVRRGDGEGVSSELDSKNG